MCVWVISGLLSGPKLSRRCVGWCRSPARAAVNCCCFFFFFFFFCADSVSFAPSVSGRQACDAALPPEGARNMTGTDDKSFSANYAFRLHSTLFPLLLFPTAVPCLAWNWAISPPTHRRKPLPGSRSHGPHHGLQTAMCTQPSGAGAGIGGSGEGVGGLGCQCLGFKRLQEAREALLDVVSRPCVPNAVT